MLLKSVASQETVMADIMDRVVKLENQHVQPPLITLPTQDTINPFQTTHTITHDDTTNSFLTTYYTVHYFLATIHFC